MANTAEQRRISHELVEAWQAVELTLNEKPWDPAIHMAVLRMQSAMDAIVAAYTPGYNAESDPDFPEEYVPGTNTPTADALRDQWDHSDEDSVNGTNEYVEWLAAHPANAITPRDVDPLTGKHNPEKDRQDPLTGEWHT